MANLLCFIKSLYSVFWGNNRFYAEIRINRYLISILPPLKVHLLCSNPNFTWLIVLSFLASSVCSTVDWSLWWLPPISHLCFASKSTFLLCLLVLFFRLVILPSSTDKPTNSNPHSSHTYTRLTHRPPGWKSQWTGVLLSLLLVTIWWLGLRSATRIRENQD